VYHQSDDDDFAPPPKVLRKRLNGVYREDHGFSGPTRRYVIMVALLVGLASVPTLAVLTTGSREIARQDRPGAMDVPFLPPPPTGPVTSPPSVTPSAGPSAPPPSSRPAPTRSVPRQKTDKDQTKQGYGEKRAPASKKTRASGSRDVPAISHPAKPRKFPAPKPVRKKKPPPAGRLPVVPGLPEVPAEHDDVSRPEQPSEIPTVPGLPSVPTESAPSPHAPSPEPPSTPESPASPSPESPSTPESPASPSPESPARPDRPASPSPESPAVPESPATPSPDSPGSPSPDEPDEPDEPDWRHCEAATLRDSSSRSRTTQPARSRDRSEPSRRSAVTERPHNIRAARILEQSYPERGLNMHRLLNQPRSEEDRLTNRPYRGQHRAEHTNHADDRDTSAWQRSTRVGRHHTQGADPYANRR
jgi:hypothetical protein